MSVFCDAHLVATQSISCLGPLKLPMCQDHSMYSTSFISIDHAILYTTVFCNTSGLLWAKKTIPLVGA